MTDLLITGKAKLSPGDFVAVMAAAIEEDADLAATLVQELVDYGVVPNTKAFAQELFEYYRYRTGGPSCPDFVTCWLYATLGKVPG